ncbi:hypothetical protein CLIM01_13904 [Colletotrichum limetticola]|uniref:Uncharacterized protein n=1 Tax=Colletotrichum limetticola TaxID=1209924 RepID=A0ABQ9PB40_9PEZI|nr:hypothetical protein CLIM01_13904 [Colletotrichum limetticola]
MSSTALSFGGRNQESSFYVSME